jgi:lipopolysaccharide transport system ATP-binding protein
MTQDLIEVRNVSKCFRVYSKPSDVLKEFVTGRTYGDDFWALRDVSLTVPYRQRLGIIGANGSGKSTLLRLITGNLQPTRGEVRVHGKLSAVLSLNSVLNPEESAYENIRFNLLLSGCPPQAVDGKIEDVLDFAELGPFAYKPVKTFSTGMGARLAFGIGTSLDPDILILDEVLSVGDAYFTAKAVKRMTAMCAKGRGLLFVSHSIADVRRLCDTVLWLEHGSIRALGPAAEVLRLYEEETRRQEDEEIRSENAGSRPDVSARQAAELREGLVRFRLASERTVGRLADTYYVRQISAEAAGRQAVIRLGADEPGPSGSWAWIDPIGCEWGRMYQRQGSPCRLLYPQTGRVPGGALLVRKPGPAAEAGPLLLHAEYRCDNPDEHLALQQCDLERCDWTTLAPEARAVTPDGWVHATWKTTLPALTAEAIDTFASRLAEKGRDDVEITKVAVEAGGGEKGLLVEGEPFDVVVHLTLHRPVRRADVGVKISRDDGLYVFWQSSGQVGQELTDAQGDAQVRFRFGTNYLGAGTYHVSVTCGNGWDLDHNYPHGRIYARRLDALRFVVGRRDARLDLGLLNVLVPVVITHAGDGRQAA